METKDRATRQVLTTLPAEYHRRLHELSVQQGMSANQLMRLGLEVLFLAIEFGQAGRVLSFEDPKTGRRAELVIPGLRRLSPVAETEA